MRRKKRRCPIPGCRRQESYCTSCREGRLLASILWGQSNIERAMRKAFANGYKASWLDPPQKSDPQPQYPNVHKKS